MSDQPYLVLIRNETDYQQMLNGLAATPGYVAIDTETTGLHPYTVDEIRGISVATRYGAWYLPISHPDSANFDPHRLILALRGKDLTFHHAVFDWAFLCQVYDDPEFWMSHTSWDTQVGNWMMDENLRTGLKESCERIFGFDAGAERSHLKAIKGKTWGTYSAEDIGTYAAMDARLTWDLREWQERYLPEQEPAITWEAFCREMEVQRSLFKMIRTGIVVDPERVAEGEADMLARLDQMNVYFVQHGVNPRSPKDVGRWLYDEHDYPCLVRTPKGKRSTAVAALNALWEQEASPEAKMLLEHRRLSKAVTAYFRPLARNIGEDGRIHPHFSSTRTVTGRFACSEPNLQTIPRDDVLPTVRRCFVARPGYELWEYDLKQAELRVIAGYADEPAMIDALEHERDLHSETAQSMWGDDFTPLQRRFAKNLNFGFAYYIGPEKFATYLSPVPTRCAHWQAAQKERRGIRKCGQCQVCEADKILAGYRETYPRLLKVRDAFMKIAERDGYFPSVVEGRYRHFKGAGYRVPFYTAFNFAVQGGIGEFMKDVMNEWYRHGPEDYPGVVLCLQIHDALVFEIPREEGLHDLIHSRLQGIADQCNPFKMRMEFDSKQWEMA